MPICFYFIYFLTRIRYFIYLDVLRHVGVIITESSPDVIFPELHDPIGAPISRPLSPALDVSPAPTLEKSASFCIPIIAPLTDVD